MPGLILVVESDARFRQSIRSRLDRCGHRVLDVREPSQAKDILRRELIDVLVVGLDGGAVERLALIEWATLTCPGTRTLALVPDGQVGLSIEAMKRGAYDDLMVPFDAEALVNAVAVALEKARAARNDQDFDR